MTTSAAATRIRDDVIAYVGAHEPVGRDHVVRDVTGRSESILATLGELVAEGLFRLENGGYVMAGWTAPIRESAEQFEAAWGAAGRPMPIPQWEAAGRPNRDAWAAAGGRFSYDRIDRNTWSGCTCEHANGGPRCRRKLCYDCRPAAG
jgi:hypothetical protein